MKAFCEDFPFTVVSMSSLRELAELPERPEVLRHMRQPRMLDRYCHDPKVSEELVVGLGTI